MNIADTSLTLNGQSIPFSRIKQTDPLDYDPHDRGIVSFLRQWLEGRSSFDAHTSGSTGEPKKILLSREQMSASATLTAQALQLKKGMTALLCLDPELIAGKMMMVRSLITGMNLIVTRPVANPLDHLPAGTAIDFAAMVPLQVITIIDSGKYPSFGNIGTVIIGGGAVSDALRSRLQNLATSFYATFGMTETMSHVALQKLNGPDQTDTFHALAGITFSVDTRGCLVINCPFAGPAQIVTNDIVDLIGPRVFKWRGRWDNVINSGGIKVMPEELEVLIQSHFDRHGITNKYFIAGIPHETLGQEIVVIVEGTLPPGKESLLLSDMKESLDKYKAPRHVYYADKFALTTMGKVRRSESLASASPRPQP
jgi:O-succinylbenzoic acid--CoA ligase